MLFRHKAVVAFHFGAGLCLLISIVLLCADSADAQQVSGNLQGRLADSLNQPVSDADVVVTGPNIQGVRGGVSDERGRFTILALPPGKVSVTIIHAAYQAVTFENILIQLGRTTYLGDIRLVPRMHELPEVIVLVDKPIIDPTTTSYGANLRSSEFENLPVERNYRSIASLLPQANLSYFGDEVNFAGATGLENKYFVDGVEVTAPVISENGTNLPYNFVQELEVRTGGYEAEYRSSLGGVLNVVTPSGSNEIHGSAFGFFTSNQFTANQRVGLLDPTQGRFFHYDAGFGIGGPIIHDELWFFAAYNPSFNRREVKVPSFGSSVDRTVMHAFAGKLTWRASQNSSIMLSATGDPTQRNAVGDVLAAPTALENPDPYFTERKFAGFNMSLHGTYLMKDNILLNGSLSRIIRRNQIEPSTERGRNDIAFYDRETNVWSGGVALRRRPSVSGTISNLTGTLFTGSHKIKGGFEYKEVGIEGDFDRHFIERTNDTLFTESILKLVVDVRSRNVSVFLQDTWWIVDNVSIQVGGRWDGQSLIGTDGNVAQRITDQFQPRAGFTFIVDEYAPGRLFGSYGRFNHELSLYLSNIYHTDKGYYYSINYKQDPRLSRSGGDTVINQPPSILPEVEGLRAQYFDEFTLGYERSIGEYLKMSVQGVYRTLGEAIEEVWIPSERRYRFGNPGRGLLSAFPRAQRDYTALIFTFQQSGRDFSFLASYVLSRNYGNYPGLYNSENHIAAPNSNSTFDDINDLKKATGLLPNDRTHVFKFSSSYRFPFGLTAGTSFILQSGTPLSELAGFGKFLSERGTVGRTPTIWDLSARFVYEFASVIKGETRLILDVSHIASQRKPVDIVQQRYINVDQNGNPVGLNPNYGVAYRYQPPMSVRVGIEVSFE